MNFEDSFERLLGHEGGFQKDYKDRANWIGGVVGQGRLVGTKFGVSAMSYPHLDIENLTVAQAEAVYRQDFWGPAGCDLVPDTVKFALFTIAVHTSAPRNPVTAKKLLQRAVGVVDDGVIGPQTSVAVSNFDPYRLKCRLIGHYLDYINNNRDQFARYGAGWSQRVAELLMED